MEWYKDFSEITDDDLLISSFYESVKKASLLLEQDKIDEAKSLFETAVNIITSSPALVKKVPKECPSRNRLFPDA